MLSDTLSDFNDGVRRCGWLKGGRDPLYNAALALADAAYVLRLLPGNNELGEVLPVVSLSRGVGDGPDVETIVKAGERVREAFARLARA